jgi:PIN domain nuclease of toxin-antitoxin system
LNGYLLDTNVAVIAAVTPERLSRAVRKAIGRGPAFLSHISYWEVVIKAMNGNFPVDDPRRWWIRTLQNLALHPLPQSAEHIAAIHDLPAIHHDPFDRALIAQATVEELTLATIDGEIPKYASPRLRVIT